MSLFSHLSFDTNFENNVYTTFLSVEILLIRMSLTAERVDRRGSLSSKLLKCVPHMKMSSQFSIQTLNIQYFLCMLMAEHFTIQCFLLIPFVSISIQAFQPRVQSNQILSRGLRCSDSLRHWNPNGRGDLTTGSIRVWRGDDRNMAADFELWFDINSLLLLN